MPCIGSQWWRALAIKRSVSRCANRCSTTRSPVSAIIPLQISVVTTLSSTFGISAAKSCTTPPISFLRANCVYIVVLDGRRAAAGGSEADYWLEHIRAFAPDAPVLLVGNKADLGPMEWDANRLRRKYPNIREGGFFQLACTDPSNPRYDFAKFVSALRDELQRASTVQQKFSRAEFNVLAELRRCSANDTFMPKTITETCVANTVCRLRRGKPYCWICWTNWASSSIFQAYIGWTIFVESTLAHVWRVSNHRTAAGGCF